MEVVKTAHSVYWLQYHVVWVCTYRRRILNPGVCSYLPPTYRVAEVMGKLKSQSASQLRDEFQWLEKVYWNETIVWSPGYFVSSVGVDAEIIKRYVEHQGAQDSGQLRRQL